MHIIIFINICVLYIYAYFTIIIILPLLFWDNVYTLSVYTLMCIHYLSKNTLLLNLLCLLCHFQNVEYLINSMYMLAFASQSASPETKQTLHLSLFVCGEYQEKSLAYKQMFSDTVLLQIWDNIFLPLTQKREKYQPIFS